MFNWLLIVQCPGIGWGIGAGLGGLIEKERTKM